MRIVFMGTPDFAVASLDKIYRSEIEVAGIVTAPDRPAGRGRKLKYPAVKEYALEKQLAILQPEKLRDPGFIGALESWNADLFVVVAFRMLPEVVWSMPPCGTINLHGSLLPDYRGAAPINWAIINGEATSGVTTFFINEHIDSGSLLLKREVPIGENETAGELHDKLMESGAELLLETIRGLSKGSIEAIPQPQETIVKEAPKLNKENTRIDFSKNAGDVHNLIRGLSPYPAAHTDLYQDGKSWNQVKILRSKVEDRNEETSEAGKILTDNRTYVHVQCGRGILRLEELQIPGKKKMKTRDLLNGFEFKEGACFA